jgi:hypothetical protein
MDRPTGKKGEVVIRTIFGEIAADSRNFSKPIEKLILDEEWRKAVGIEGGPFCYVPDELDIPF